MFFLKDKVLQYHFKKKILLLVLVSFYIIGYSQDQSSGIILGAKFGISRMVAEVSSDFKQHITEFNQKPGFAMDLEVSKLLSSHFEIGTNVNYCNLQGTQENPQFTAIGNHHSLPVAPVGPVEYHNRLLGQKFFIGYYFRNFSDIDEVYSIEPFLRMGIGYIDYAVELKYIDSNLGSIFSKGVGEFDNVVLSTTVYFISGGIKTNITPRFFMNVTFSINYVPYDFLDGVYNFNNGGERSDMNGLYSEFKIGFFYQLKRKRKYSQREGSSLPFSK